MQSGISVSTELHDAFNDLVSSPSQRGLVATIQSESIIPLHTIPASSLDFFSDLASLTPLLSDKEAAYIILRRYQNAPDGYLAVTFVPDTAPVRQKMLFASTRLTLVRELGTERFRESLFMTEMRELGEGAWKKHEASSVLTAPLTEEEETLKSVREAEYDASRGTERRRLETGGKLSMAISGEAMEALKKLSEGEAGELVQLRIDTQNESIELVGRIKTDASGLATEISDTEPRYSLFRYRHSFEGVDESPILFIYTCPSGLKIRERMLYASSDKSIRDHCVDTRRRVQTQARAEAGLFAAQEASAVASAVILPEAEEQPRPPTPSLKRRQSPLSDAGSKRPRLSQDGIGNRQDGTTMSPLHSAREDRVSEKRRSGQMQEERKRGQRLFGALLGTLSQSSSSAANKRRADIEKKQQAKLRLQTEEENEKRKTKLEELMAVRRREQKRYDKQSYYKPWELLPGDEEKIRDQVKEAETIIDRESIQYGDDHPDSPKNPLVEARRVVDRESKEATDGHQKMDGKDTDATKPAEPKINDTLSNDAVMSDGQERPPQSEAAKDTGDDGGEVVEGEEDTRAAEDVKELARQLGTGKVISGGHDWFSDLVTSIFTVCTPYHVPTRYFTPPEAIVQNKMPFWAYQIQLASGEVKKHVRSEEEMGQFLNALYGGRGPNGKLGFDRQKGLLFEHLPQLGKTRLLDQKSLDYYVE
ncbi:MAG: hypothetical protein Q9217_000867 [Psora testacea]